MQTFIGKSVSEGVGFGMIKKMNKDKAISNYSVPNDDSLEWKKIQTAIENVSSRIMESHKDNALFCDLKEAYLMILSDEEYIGVLKNRVYENHDNALDALCNTRDYIEKVFKESKDLTLEAKISDVYDLSDMLISDIKNQSGSCECDNEEKLSKTISESDFKETPLIIVSEYLKINDILKYGEQNIKGLIASKDSSLSHAVMMAKALRIPCVIGCDIDIDESLEGKYAFIDSDENKVYIGDKNEFENIDDRLKEKQKMILADQISDTKNEEDANDMVTSTCQTGQKKIRDMVKEFPNRKIKVYANIANVNDAAKAFSMGAEGIGLFRSEYLYIEASDYPSEDEQFEAYKKLAESAGGKEVIIRTMDCGADKKADYMFFPEENNPAMGIRGIRYSLLNPEIFKTQLRAILRAASFGNISIMFPMITSLSEVIESKMILNEAADELESEGKTLNRNIKVGIMIETPASVMIANELAGEVDFFSVGTNDLTQYTLGIDRSNAKLEKRYDPHHPAIIKMLEMTAKATKENGIGLGIFGQLAGEADMLELFEKLGFDEISVDIYRL